MDKDDFQGSVKFVVTTGMMPWGDHSEFVHTIKGTALAFTDDYDEEEAGQITLSPV